MNLGTGIFLSTLLVCFVTIFHLTRKSWEWKIILKWAGISLTGILLVGAGIWWGIYSYNQKPKRQLSYSGIELGFSSKDVRFTKGKPDSVIPGIENCSCDSLYSYEEDDSILKKNSLQLIRFKKRKVVGIVQLWWGNEFIEGIQGIGSYSSLDDVKKKFGEPDSIRESDSGDERRYFYAKYNVRFGLEKAKVKSIGIYDPSN